MDRRMVTAVVTTAVVAAAITAFIATRVGPGAPPPRDEVTIALNTVNGTCEASDPLPLKQYSARVITWKVVNNCSGAQWIQIKDFKQKDPGTGGVGGVQQVLNQNPNGAVPQNGADFRATITRNVSILETWKYDIWVGPSEASLHLSRDPDLEIWP